MTYTATSSSVSEVIYKPWKSFQNIVIASNCWVAATNANEWIQLQYPYPISMSGFNIIARNITGRSITNWKVQASDNGTTFIDIVNPNSTTFNAAVLNKFTFPASDKYKYWRLFIISSVGSIDVGIGMLQWIPTLPDRYLKKCNSGYVPSLTPNVNYRGFTPSASSEYSTNYIVANVFKGLYASGTASNAEWTTASGVVSNFG